MMSSDTAHSVAREGADQPTEITSTMRDGLLFMGNWRNVFVSQFGERPAVLYHYTNPTALKGILVDNEIWATNAVFMNDKSEIWHAGDVLRRVDSDVVSDSEFKGVDPNNLLLATTPIRLVIGQLHSYVEAYVACFSTEEDLLSQWRGYGEYGGLSIGFEAALLDKRPQESVGFSTALVQVVYDPDEQYRQIYALERDWIKMYLKCLAEDSETRSHVEALLFAQCFAWLASSFKNVAFEGEQEWRLIYVRTRLPQKLPDEPFAVSFRVADGMLVPFVRFRAGDLASGYSRLPISSVRVGPHRYPELAASGVWHLISELDLNDRIRIEVSQTPLRI